MRRAGEGIFLSMLTVAEGYCSLYGGICVSFYGQGIEDQDFRVPLDRPRKVRLSLADYLYYVAAAILGQRGLAGSSKTVGFGQRGRRDKERKIGLDKS